MLEVIRQKYRDCSSLNFLGEIRLQLPFKKCFPQLPQFLSPLLICLVPLWSALPAAIPSSNTSMRDLWLTVLWCRAMASGKVRATKQHRKKKKKRKRRILPLIESSTSHFHCILYFWDGLFPQVFILSPPFRGWGVGFGRKERRKGEKGERQRERASLGERERENMTDTLYSLPWHVYIICCWHSVQKPLWEEWCNLRC